jgi:hypothetical protein
VGTLFNRALQLDIFANNQRVTLVNPGSRPGIDSLFFEFDINVSRDKEPNRAQISVYNLNQTNRDLFTANHQGVELSAGYNGEVKLLFRGVTTNVIHNEERTFIKTTFFCGDGEKEYGTQKFNKSYSKGTLISLIFQDMAKALGLPNEVLIDDIAFTTLLKGRSFSGLVKDALTELTEDYGFQWSIQQGTLEITVKGEPIISQPFATVLSSDTGMIGRPKLIERQSKSEKTKEKKSEKAKEKGEEKEERIIGVSVTSLLNADIYPNRLIKIIPQQTQTETLGKLMEAKTPAITAEGVWLVDKAHFFGDNMTGPYHVEAEADITKQVL